MSNISLHPFQNRSLAEVNSLVYTILQALPKQTADRLVLEHSGKRLIIFIFILYYFNRNTTYTRDKTQLSTTISTSYTYNFFNKLLKVR